MSITERYIYEFNKYKKQYGDKTLVLMQVGSFYEMYSTDTIGPDLKNIADLLNTVCTKKDKSVKEVSISNPYLVGFPMVATDKFVSLLIRNGYTLVMVDQVTPPPEPQRKVTNIYSPSTYIGSTSTIDNNYAVFLYFEYEQQKSNVNLLCTGMSALDITTGNVLIDEGISNIADTEIAFDNTLRFLSITQPKEIFLTLNGKGKYDINALINMLQIDTRIVSIKKFDEKYTKIKFQTEFLGQIYKNSIKMNMSIIETLNLEKNIYARISLIMLIDNVRNYSENLIKDISEPEINIDTNHMILGNNAIFQLSILENDGFNYLNGTKFKCLYDVVNNAKTAMGKRFIKHILCNPLISDKKIQEYYELTEFIIKNSLYDKYSEKLKQIIDIEKYSRKMNLTMLNPYELLDFIDSIEYSKDIINNIKSDKISMEFKKDKFNKIEEFLKDMNDIFIKNELQCNILNDIKTNLFKPNISKEIDLLWENYNAEHKILTNLQDVFNKVLFDYQKRKSDKDKLDKDKSNKDKSNKDKSNKDKSNKDKSKKVIKNEDTNYLKISNTPSEGYFIMTSKQRFDIIKKHYEKTKEIILLQNNMEINFENLEIKDLKNSIKIFFKNTKSKDRDIAEIENKLLKHVYETYIIKLKEIYEKYNDIFVYIRDYITKIDYIISNAITAKRYNYVKPNLIKNEHNFINAQQIRHPIVERLIDYEYVPHDILLDDKLNGMLIYGLNSSGKSVMMKAIGLSLIMAQCGMYVPSTKFDYTIYNSIYTRITGNDNIFRGQSSFTLEMTELNSIIKRANNKSLVIGDEICRGTENISGNALVASTIIHLAKKKATFIFATHLHELVHLESIRKLENVKAFHLSVDYDTKSDILIYDRTLKEGSGDKVYGILVAKYIIDNKEFIEDTLKIKNELTNSFSTMISGKKSRYNAELYVYKCEKCGKTEEEGAKFLETHHINFQSNCKDGFSIDKPHLKMNSVANLTVICEKCHDALHNKEIKIEKKTSTSKGKKLL